MDYLSGIIGFIVGFVAAKLIETILKGGEYKHDKLSGKK